MRKVYQLEDLDCALCAEKMEKGITKIKGVKEANVNFMTQRLIIEIEEDYNMDSIMDEVQRVCKKIEPDCLIKR